MQEGFNESRPREKRGGRKKTHHLSAGKCSWCSSENTQCQTKKINGKSGYVVQCFNSRCLARGPLRSTERDAIMSWNDKTFISTEAVL